MLGWHLVGATLGTTHAVLVGCITLVAIVGFATQGAGVRALNFVVVGPTIVAVGEVHVRYLATFSTVAAVALEWC
jgi:hypothetical protein